MNPATARWFLARGREKIGPLAFEELGGMALLRQLTPADMLLPEGSSRWIPAAEVSDLFPVLTTATETPPGAGATTDLPSPLQAPTQTYDAPPAPPRPGVIGSQIADYQIVKELGRGGMGVVYQARQLSLNRLVALKMILAGEHAGAAALARFQNEAEAIARLRHPNIVQIYEVGEHQGCPFISLEFCDAGGLDTWLQGKPIPAREAAGLLETLARAMHHAHQQGIIHRDLKPGNILLIAECPGEPAPRTLHSAIPKITDFGLARKLDEQAKTQTGAVMGTPAYMAPEQAAGRTHDLGPAVDIYALGALLYECLTGRPPFNDASVMETLRLVQDSDPVAPRQLVPGTPRDLEVICLKCLHKDPARRYASAEELAADLRRFLDGVPIKARPVSRRERLWRWTKRNPALTSVAVLLLLSLGAGVTGIELKRREAVDNFNDKEEQRRLAEASAENARRKEEEANRLRELAEKREAEKDQFVYASLMNQVPEAWQRGDLATVDRFLRTFEPRPGQQTTRGFEWDYYWKLMRGSRLALWGHAGQVNGLAFSPDGTLLATGGGDRTARLWDTRTGREVWKFTGPTAFSKLAFSADGKVLAAKSVYDSTFLNADKGTRLRPLKQSDLFPAFSPDNKVYASGTGRTIQLHDAANDRVLLSIPDGHKKQVGSAIFSADGRWMFSGAGDGVRLWQVEGGWQPGSVRPRGITPRGSRDDVNPNVPIVATPDARRVVCLTWDNLVEVWSADLEKGEFRLDKTFSPARGAVKALAITADGKVVVTAGLDGLIRLWDVASGAERQALGGHALAVVVLAVSADGRLLASAGSDGVVRVWDLESATRTARRESVNALACSPTEDLLVSAGDDGSVRLWDSQTGASRGVLLERDDPVKVVAFTPNGRELAVGYPDGVIELWDVAARRPLGKLEALGAVTSLAVSPDGNVLAAGTEAGMLALFDLPKRRRTRQELVHAARITALTFTSDGRTVVTGSADCLVRSFDLEGGVWKTLFRMSVAVAALTLLPEDRLVIGTRNYQVWRHDLRKGGPAFRVGWYPYGAVGFCATPDGKSLFAAAWEGDIGCLDYVPLDPSPGDKRRQEMVFDAPLRAVVMARDGKRIAAATSQGVVVLWDVATHKVVARVAAHTRAATALACAPDGRTLVRGGRDGSVRLLDAATLVELASLSPHTASVTAVCFSRDGQRVASASVDGTIQVWDAATRKRTAQGADRRWPYPIRHILFSPDGRTLFSGGGQLTKTGTLTQWDAQTGAPQPFLPEHKHRTTIRQMALVQRDRVLVTVTGTEYGFPGELKLWDLEHGQELCFLTPHSAPINALAVTSDGRTLATGAEDSSIRVWDIGAPQQPIETQAFHGHNWGVRALAFAPDGRTLLSTADDGTLCFWDPRQGLPLGRVRLAAPARCLAFHPGKNVLYVGDDNGNVRIHESPRREDIAAEAARVEPGERQALALQHESERHGAAGQRQLAALQRQAQAFEAAAHSLREANRRLAALHVRAPNDQQLSIELVEALLELADLPVVARSAEGEEATRLALEVAEKLLSAAPRDAEALSLVLRCLYDRADLLEQRGDLEQTRVLRGRAAPLLRELLAQGSVTERTVQAALRQGRTTASAQPPAAGRDQQAKQYADLMYAMLRRRGSWRSERAFLKQFAELLDVLEELQRPQPKERLGTLRLLFAVSRLRALGAEDDLGLREALARSNVKLGDAEETSSPADAARHYGYALDGWEALRHAQPRREESWTEPARIRERLARLHLKEGKHGEATRRIEEALRDLAGVQELSAGRPKELVTTWRRLAGLLASCSVRALADAALKEEERRLKGEECAARAVELLRQCVRQGYKDSKDLESSADLEPLRRRADFMGLLKALSVPNQP